MTDRPTAVILDIDGTLTPAPWELVIARKDAAKAATIFHRKGYQIIYLSARPAIFARPTREWLSLEGFPVGSLHLAEDYSDVAHPDQFKSHILEGLADAGWTLAFAYGDLPSDFAAYALWIPRDRVFALRHERASCCEAGQYALCLADWTEHLPYIEQVPVLETT